MEHEQSQAHTQHLELMEEDGEQLAINTHSSSQPRSACFNCRSVRQRCNRKIPCSRCVSQHKSCEYPSTSNRGRKMGSTNKPDTVEKLLSRINASSVRDQIIAALFESNIDGANDTDFTEPVPVQAPEASGTLETAFDNNLGGTQPVENNGVRSRRDTWGPVVSPLHIMGEAFAAVTVNSTSAEQGHEPAFTALPLRHATKTGVSTQTVERLIGYFGSQTTQQKDWQVLANQNTDITFKLDSSICDPLTARLIDHDDAEFYFKRFFEVRNPFVGLLDPNLHTPGYVYSMSFTLFSVICALGCAVSTRSRDRVLYPTLLTIAEGSMKWSIAACVRSLEIIQAIINLQYWAPICQKQSEDPSWLYLNHATQLSRETGIYKHGVVNEYLKTLPQSATVSHRERIVRNFERTWLYIFIADKSFGIISGRPPMVPRGELPATAATWWQSALASPHDRMISGIVEIRILLLSFLDQRQNLERNLTSVLNWQRQAMTAMEQVRSARCVPDHDASSVFLPILAFYMDHSILVLNSQTDVELAALEGAPILDDVSSVSQMTANIASRMIDLVLTERVLCDYMLGFHNNQFIMICHAATEIIRTLKKGSLPLDNLPQLSLKLRSVPERFCSVAQNLPSSSVAHLYLGLFQVFASQFDKLVESSTLSTSQYHDDNDSLLAELYRGIDDGSLGPAAFLDMGFLGWELPDNFGPPLSLTHPE